MFPRIASFAQQHPGHHYFIGDEPDWRQIPAADVAAYFCGFATAIHAADPTATFGSPGFAGLYNPNQPHHGPANPGPTFTTYAQAFLNAYQANCPDGPEISEWRFNIYDTDWWATEFDQAAAWAASRGGTAVITTGFWWSQMNGVNVLPLMTSMLNALAADSRVSYVLWWSYHETTSLTTEHLLSDANGNLTPEGVLYASYARGPASLPQNSLVEQPDYNADGYADYAEYYLPTRQFYAHFNQHSTVQQIGPFAPPTPWLQGQTPLGADWDVLVADFNGDNYGDYADVHIPSGQVWIHLNQAGASFDVNYWAWVDFHDNGTTPDYEILAGDVDGDGKADLIERQLSTGLVWAKRNQCSSLPSGPPCVSSNNFPDFNLGGAPQGRTALGRTFHGPDWRAIVVNVLPDGTNGPRVEFLDQHLPSGQFWVHRVYTQPAPGTSTGKTWHISTRVEGFGDASDASPSSGWRTVFGDFNYDGYADFADLHVSSGQMWFHVNHQNGTFDPPGAPGIYMWNGVNVGANWEIFGSR